MATSFEPVPFAGPAPPGSAFFGKYRGTVTDNATRLMWEIKGNEGGLHDVDDVYSWAGTCSVIADRCQADQAALNSCPVGYGGYSLCPRGGGTCQVTDGQAGSDTILRWVTRLNAAAFAGHTDWQIPHFIELTSIVAEPFPCDIASPCEDAATRSRLSSRAPC